MARPLCLETKATKSVSRFCLFFIIHGLGQAVSSEVEDPSPQCIDPVKNATVSEEMCEAGCCVYKGEGGSYDDSYPIKKKDTSNMKPYCGTRLECEAVKRRRKWGAFRRARGEKPWWDPKGISLMCILSVCVVGAARMKYKAMQKSKQKEMEWKQREVDVRNKLDVEFPPEVYGKANNPESQSCEGEVCCICLEGLEGTIVRKLHCSHVLHQHCFDRWCLHSSDPQRGRGLDQNMPEESIWACPFCKHPAIPEQVGATGTISVAEQGQAGSPRNGVVSEDDQPEAPAPSLEVVELTGSLITPSAGDP